MGICLRYEKNKDDAAALLNLAFFKILTRLDQYKDNVPFEAWAKRVTINTLIDEFRKKNKDQHQFVESFDHSLPLSFMDFNEADQRFDAEDLERMIRDLPEMSQKVFNLYIIDGYNHKEIGEMLHISEGTSMASFHCTKNTEGNDPSDHQPRSLCNAMTEKDLKKLFQKKFGEREVSYEPGSWSAVEQMLDKATPVAWYRRSEIVQRALC